ncbi:MAG: nucleoside triphosphate pyrophosphohydrolase [Saprospiraceae bacterium]|nr:nucleoside triphosphate pyrophosphohydrolase [Saprospiraceae bacterium]MBK9631914.1 nucleoside triphosphate pyrophosphohydrolase [Saprospiraceae bacterium]
MERNLSEAFLRLVKIMDELRESCPWDRKQTIQSLRNLTIEETYELADAILSEDFNGIKEELGDLLLHILFYAKIANEQDKFTLESVLEGISEKLIFRHPHIYGDVKVKDEEEVKRNWEKLKQKEKKIGVLAGVPISLPSMVKAFRLQEKASQVGFDWPDSAQVIDKIMEEIGEFTEVVRDGKDQAAIEDELGDVLFSVINLARFMKVDPEASLERTNRKFIQRFEFIEKNANKPLTEMSLEEMELLWQQAKSGA